MFTKTYRVGTACGVSFAQARVIAEKAPEGRIYYGDRLVEVWCSGVCVASEIGNFNKILLASEV
jgi:hypothetical protein